MPHKICCDGELRLTFQAYTTLRPKGVMSRRARALARSVYAVLDEVARRSIFNLVFPNTG